MGRSFAKSLSPAEKTALDKCIETYQFYNVDSVVVELEEQGIKASRSAVARYIKAQRERREALPVLETPTVVTIVDCATGRVRTIHTAISLDDVEAMICSKN